jgi:Raf kinase inhibitor-like YbhB/YbcL family protein
MPVARAFKNGAKHGVNDFQKFGYGGPYPPCGTHRYYFKLYALDIELTREPGLTKEQLLTEMQGHILDEGQLMGRYTR